MPLCEVMLLNFVQATFPRLAFNVQNVGTKQLQEASINGSSEVNKAANTNLSFHNFTFYCRQKGRLPFCRNYDHL